MKILVVCLGNINRSPFVAALLQRDGYETRSAGLINPGRRAAPRMREAAKRYNLNLDDHRSQLVSSDLLDWADWIVYFNEAHSKRLGLGLRGLNLGQFLVPPQKGIRDPATVEDITPIVEQMVTATKNLGKGLL